MGSELGLVLSFLLPAVDAYRVIKGVTHDDDTFEVMLPPSPPPPQAFFVSNVFSFSPSPQPFMMMIFMKCTEIVVESIPASVLQTYAFLLSDRSSLRPLVSIFFSVLSIAYGTAMISLDMDCSPEKRHARPEFYGYVPSDGTARLVVFVSMVLFSAAHIALKVAGVAMLSSVGGAYVAAVVGGDVLLFMGIKIARRDWTYWIRFSGFMSFIASLLARCMNKLLTDYTSCVHFR